MLTQTDLVLKRAKDYRQGEGYLVYFAGRCVGRIFNAGAGTPKDQPWFWGMTFDQLPGRTGRSTATLPI